MKSIIKVGDTVVTKDQNYGIVCKGDGYTCTLYIKKPFGYDMYMEHGTLDYLIYYQKSLYRSKMVLYEKKYFNKL
jgi:hypothetical protein